MLKIKELYESEDFQDSLFLAARSCLLGFRGLGCGFRELCGFRGGDELTLSAGGHGSCKTKPNITR